MKKTCLFILLIAIQFSVFAQESDDEEKVSLKDRIFFGGSFGLSFGDVTFIELSPVVGYQITPRFSAGGGIIYQYTSFRRSDFSSHTYGGRAFGIAKLFDPFFAQLEYEYLNYEFYTLPEGSQRMNYSSVLGGGGVSQPLSKNLFLNFTALYNFTFGLQSLENRPYASPWVIRVAVIAGF